jgi:hypothetical protein
MRLGNTSGVVSRSLYLYRHVFLNATENAQRVVISFTSDGHRIPVSHLYFASDADEFGMVLSRVVRYKVQKEGSCYSLLKVHKGRHFIPATLHLETAGTA